MTPNDLLKDIEKYNFDYFVEEALQRVPVGIDTREGAIIYDALAPAAYSFAELAMSIHDVLIDTYTQTAQGEFLDYRAIERGLKRKPATFTQALARFTDQDGQPFKVEIGTRFSSIGTDPVYYSVTKQVDGGFIITAERAGNAPNRYIGQLLPVDNINGLGYAEITKIEIPAADAESDDALRKRVLASNTFTEYGGNVADYRAMLATIPDVGAAQIYPTWNGGGTVRVVILNNEFLQPTQRLIDEVQEVLDPTDAQGDGYGMAPIGHTVTVASPTAKTIELEIGIDTDADLTYVDLTPAVTEAINKYFDDQRRSIWPTVVNNRHYSLTIYRSQLMAAILQVPGVVNVSQLTLDKSTSDISLVFDNTKQEVPIVGGVDIHG